MVVKRSYHCSVYNDKADGDHDCQYDGNMMTMMMSLTHAHHHDAGSGGDCVHVSRR